MRNISNNESQNIMLNAIVDSEIEKLKKSLENSFKDAIQNGLIKIANGNEKLFEIINDVMK